MGQSSGERASTRRIYGGLSSPAAVKSASTAKGSVSILRMMLMHPPQKLDYMTDVQLRCARRNAMLQCALHLLAQPIHVFRHADIAITTNNSRKGHPTIVDSVKRVAQTN